jgi:hypothetical protein
MIAGEPPVVLMGLPRLSCRATAVLYFTRWAQKTALLPGRETRGTTSLQQPVVAALDTR